MIDLAALIKRTTKTRRASITLPPIVTTQAQADELAKRFVAVLRIWSVATRDLILPAYGRALREAAMTMDSPADVRLGIDTADARVVQAILEFRDWFPGWADNLTRWHFLKLLGALKYATGVDYSTAIGMPEAGDILAAVLERNTALITNISRTARDKIAEEVFRGLQQRTPMREVARSISGALNGQRDRALRVASDQTVKLAATLDQERQEQLGITKFTWRHSGKVHFRPEHKARDGKVFAWRDPALRGDLPGQIPFCGCKAQAYIEL